MVCEQKGVGVNRGPGRREDQPGEVVWWLDQERGRGYRDLCKDGVKGEWHDIHEAAAYEENLDKKVYLGDHPLCALS